ncbi:MAG: alpha-1,2-fucosyltransferase [Flavobacteriales bacterium]
MSTGIDDRPVVTRLAGGLGNQMFQYAAGQALAQHLGVPLLLDTGRLEARPKGMSWTARGYALEVFNIDTELVSPELLTHFGGDASDEPWLRIMHKVGLVTRESRLLERSKLYDPDFFSQEPPVLLDGYWQCERYFATIATELRQRIFVPRSEPSANNQARADLMGRHNAASIHVRRGDYVTNSEAARYHGVCPPEYYRSAADELVRAHGVDHFFVFSDDADWVRANLQLPYPTTVNDHNPGDQSHWDLWLMRHCKHHIIANSSFSWWGAWLSEPAGRTVIAPRNWFADPAIQHDILPIEWLAR